MMKILSSRKGRTLLAIDADGRLVDGDGRDAAKALRSLRFNEGLTRTALDGSRVTEFTYGGTRLRRFVSESQTWWSTVDSLCTPDDIERVRRERAKASPEASA